MKSEASQGKTLDTGQEKKGGTGKSGIGRTRVFAIVVYPDSAPEDWQDKLTQEHVQALISPLHDRDTNPDGSQKKPHWHVLVMFDGVKTQEQVDAMWDRVLGSDRVKHYETVNSTRGYARYLCHKDNPEKAQYSDGDVIALGGADYQELVQLGSDDRSTLKMVFAYIRERGIGYYDQLVDACMADDMQSAFALITEKRTLAVTNYLKARASREKAERERAEKERHERELGRGLVRGVYDTTTGEFIPDTDNDTDKEG